MKSQHRLAQDAVDALVLLAGELDSTALSGEAARTLNDVLVRAMNLASHLVGVTAARMDELDAWRSSGAGSGAQDLSNRSGLSSAEAAKRIAVGRAVASMPALAAAVKTGALSSDKVAAVVIAGVGNDAEMTAFALENGLVRVQRRARELERAAKPAPEQDRSDEHVRSQRFLHLHKDEAAGLLRLSGALPLVDAGAFLRDLDREAEVLRRTNPQGSFAQQRADALLSLLHNSGNGRGLVGKVEVQVNVDLPALLRGHVVGDEVCEVRGLEPIPVWLAEQWADSALMKIVIDKGCNDFVYATKNRRPTKRQQEQILARDGLGCSVPGCDSMFRLQFDHRRPWSPHGGAANKESHVDNISMLCWHHHVQKSRDGWCLVGTLGSPDVRWVKRRDSGEGGVGYPLDGSADDQTLWPEAPQPDLFNRAA